MNKVTARGLPQHNLLLRGVYILAVVGMFVFMTIVIGGYWTTKTDYVPVSNLVERPSLNIIGKSFLLDLDQPVEDQLTAFWGPVFNDGKLLSSNTIMTDKVIYQIYYNYSESNNTVEVLLGFKVNNMLRKRGYQLVHLPKVDMLPGESVLGSWVNYQSLPVSLRFELDYEVLELDKHYEIISQKAFLNLKEGS